MLTFVCISGCGYDVVLQYKAKASVGYRLTITSDTPQQASSFVKQTFLSEDLEPVHHIEFDTVERSYIYHNSSMIMITLNLDFKTANIAIYPARLNSVSSKRRAQLKQREEAILRIKQVLEKSDSFTKYIPSEWEREYNIYK